MGRKTPNVKLDGKPLQLDRSWVPRAVALIKRLPRHCFYTRAELARRVGVSEASTKSHAPALDPFRLQVGVSYYYGSQAGIALLRRELEAQRNSRAPE